MARTLRILIFLLSFTPWSLPAATEDSFADEVIDAELQSRHSNHTLNIGEAEKLTLPKGASVQVSRRGIVDIQVYPKHLRVLGLKSGLVVLTVVQENKADEDFKYFIEVRPKGQEEAPKSDEIAHLTKAAGLEWDSIFERIHGQSADFKNFYQLKNLCDLRNNCSFQATLNESEQNAVTQNISKSLGPRFQVSVKESGAILVLASCNEKITEKNQQRLVEHLAGSEIYTKNVLVSCKEQIQSHSYLLYAKIIVVEKSLARELGWQGSIDANLGSQNPLSMDTNLKLDAALKTKRAHVLGEPVIWLLGASEARLQSGSEVLVAKDTNEHKNRTSYSWKELGLDLKVKVFALEAKKAHMQYSFTVSTASSQTSSHIQKNKIESEIAMPLEQPAVVGGIQFKSEGESDSLIPYLDSIPIIGPIFKRSAKNDSETSLYLHFYLKESEEAGLPLSQKSPLEAK